MHVCLVVPAVGDHAAHVASAVRAAHHDVHLVAVWAGDPHLRPLPPPGARWIDHALPEPTGVGWGRALVTLTPEAYALARTALAVARLLDGGVPSAVVLDVGRVAVLGAVGDLDTATGVVVGGRPAPGPTDGLGPTTDDHARAGRWSTSAFGVAADAAALLRQLAGALAGTAVPEPGSGTGAVFAGTFEGGGTRIPVRSSDQLHVVGWAAPPEGPIAVLDVSLVDGGDPMRIRTGPRPARVRLSEHPRLVEWLGRTAPQWAGVDRTLALTGGVRVDATMRALAADAVEAWRRGDGDLPPDPWDAMTGSFVEWMETPWPAWGADIGRYWRHLHAQRRDLVAAFPQPDRGDRAAFAAWADSSWRHEPRSRLLRATARPLRPPWFDESREPGGVNLVGYHGFDSSLGDVVRRLRGALDAAGVAVAPIHYHRSGSPPIDPQPGGLTDRLRHDTNLLVINADQMANVDADHGDVLWPGRRSIGYWFWDVEYVPPHVVEAMRFLDEIWVATPFTAQALGAVTDRPVRVVEIPVPEPVPGAVTRRELGLPDGRFVFLVTFDHLSVTERKNPIGAIEAFCRAFPEPSADGPMLVVKTLNASHRWVEHERVRLATLFRPDIAVVDRHLSRGEQLAMIASADCLVSLHRSEGLGLHLIEAMWLGTPTIATRYSGNVHIADDDSALLIDARMVPVERGEDYFPPEATWADPDLDAAAASMRRLVAEPALCDRLAAAGRARMQRQPSPAEAGERVAALLRDRSDISGGSRT
jgi:glycosyltransferase involved in cell wall biosynthesis